MSTSLESIDQTMMTKMTYDKFANTYWLLQIIGPKGYFWGYIYFILRYIFSHASDVACWSVHYFNPD